MVKLKSVSQSVKSVSQSTRVHTPLAILSTLFGRKPHFLIFFHLRERVRNFHTYFCALEYFHSAFMLRTLLRGCNRCRYGDKGVNALAALRGPFCRRCPDFF